MLPVNRFEEFTNPDSKVMRYQKSSGRFSREFRSMMCWAFTAKQLLGVSKVFLQSYIGVPILRTGHAEGMKSQEGFTIPLSNESRV